MAQEQAVTALVFDARGAVNGAKEFEAASARAIAANKNVAAAEELVAKASDRLQKAQESASKAIERAQQLQQKAAAAAERYGAASEQAARAADRLARASEASAAAQDRVARAQDRLAQAQDRAVAATERVQIGLAGQERRLAAIEAKYAPAIAAENRFAQTKEYLNGVIQRGGPQMERAQKLLEALTEQERKAAQASQQVAQAMAAGTAATVRAAQAQEMAAGSTKKLNGFIQQAGYQVSDAANQIATGTNAFTVFGMQAGQLIGTLGPMGAAIGAVVNVAGVAAGVIQKQAAAAEEAAKATDLLTAATRAGLEITESGVDKARRLRDERNEQAGASYRAAIAERELADALAISAALSARAAMEQTKASNERYLAQGPGRFLGPAELSRIEYEQKVYEGTSKTATETAKRLDEAQQAYEKFRGSLNKTGGFSGEEVDKLKERVDGIVSSYDDATLRTVTLRQKQEELDEAVKAGVVTQSQADDILKKYTVHLDENSKAAKEAEKSANAREKAEEKLEKQILAAVKAADAKAVEEYNKVMGEGKRIYDATRTPAEKYADEVANLRRLLDYGAINQDTFNRAIQAADPAFKEAQQAAERYAQEINRVAEDIANDWSETLYDAIILSDKQASIVDSFRDLFKRIAIEAIKANIVLPITQQVVGAVPSLFGIQAPAGAAANQNGGGMGGVGGQALSLGSKFIPSSWTSSITTAIDQWGMSSLGIGTATAPGMTAAAGGAAQAAGVSAVPGGVSNAAVANGAVTGGLTSYLGPLGAGLAVGGLLGPMLANGNKAVGGLAGGASGAAAGALVGSMVPGVGTLIGALIGGAGGGLGGLLGTQKPSVGKTASSDVTISNGVASYGNILTDNEGDAAAGQALGQTVAALFNAAKAGGGTLTKDFGFGQTEKGGYYIGGSVPMKEFKDDFAGMVRYALLEQGGLQGGGVNTLAALRNSTNKDAGEFSKDVVLGASIDAGNTALKEFDKSLAGVTKSAKEATTNSLAPMFEELERAKKLGINGAYVQLASDQLVNYLDTLRNPVAYTETETAVASMKGQFQAMREAAEQLNPAIVGTIDAIQRETTARMAADLNRSLDSQIREAGGRGYINQIQGFLTSLDANARSLLAVGEPVTRANDLFNVSLTELLRTLRDDQLADVVQTFGGDIGNLATQLAAANDNLQQTTQFETLFSQIRQDNIQADISALNDQINVAKSAQSQWQNLLTSIGSFRGSLLTGDLSPLSAKDKAAESLSQFFAAVDKANGGDLNAAGQVQSLAQTALQANKTFLASSEDYARVFDQVQDGLGSVESVASKQVSLQNSQLSTLQASLATQQNTLKALQVVPADIAAIIKGITPSNSTDVLNWSKTQDAGTQTQVKRAVLESYTNAQIEAAFGGFSDIQAARAADPNFNLAEWFKGYGINEVLNGQRSIPGFATGTDYAPGGLAWVGERGPELMQLPTGSRIYPHSESMGIAKSWGAANDRWSGNVLPFRGGQSGGLSSSDQGWKAVVEELKALNRDQTDLGKAMVMELAQSRRNEAAALEENRRLRQELSDARGKQQPRAAYKG